MIFVMKICVFAMTVDGLTDELVYYINFGPHGPRAERVKDGWQVVGGLATCIAVSFAIFWGLRQYSIISSFQHD
jgi:hypothetical protein